MNEDKLKQLFTVARGEPAPCPPADFAGDVLRAIRHEPVAAPAGALALFDQLNRWFPRLAIGAVALIVLCVAGDFALTAAGLPDVGDGVPSSASPYFAGLEDL